MNSPTPAPIAPRLAKRGKLAEHHLLLARHVLQRLAHRLGELRVGGRREGAVGARAARALRAELARVVRLVPRRPVRDPRPVVLGLGGERDDRLPVGVQRVVARRAGEGLGVGALAAARRARGPRGRAREDDQHVGRALALLLARGDRAQLLAHALKPHAGLLVAQAAVGEDLPVGLGALAGLGRGPIDDQAQVARVELVELGARVVDGRRELGLALRRPQQVRVVLREADGERAGRLRRGLGRRRGGRRRPLRLLGVAAAAGERQNQRRKGGAPTRNRAGQTAETSSSSATRNEEPQPQAAITFGFSTLKPAPWRLST